MTEDQMNHESEVLAGMNLDDVRNAILHSGYPFQTTVSELLREHFSVMPEWGFRDRFSKELRTLDMLGIRALSKFNPQRAAHPFLVALIECKKSQSPYVFFTEKIHVDRNASRIPMICGMPRRDIMISDADSDTNRAYAVHINRVLDMHENPFVVDVPCCSVFSKCVHKRGGGVELSGSEAYSGIVMPIMSALSHFEDSLPKQTTPPATRKYVPIFMVLAIAIVDAPMLAYDPASETNQLSFVKWHRVIRNEPENAADPFASLGIQTAIDVVHSDYFPTYLNDYVLPLARHFGNAIERHGESFLRGSAMVHGYGEDHLYSILDRIYE